MGVRVKEGDVFLVPLDGDQYVYGQVIAKHHGELYIAVFEGTFSKKHYDVNIVLTLTPFILALTLDALLWHGNWKIIGNIKHNLDKLPELFFKIETSYGMLVESRDQTSSKSISLKEAEGFRFRTVVAPIRIQKAVEAHYGFKDWLSKYDDLKSDYAFKVENTMSDLTSTSMNTHHKSSRFRRMIKAMGESFSTKS